MKKPLCLLLPLALLVPRAAWSQKVVILTPEPVALDFGSRGHNETITEKLKLTNTSGQPQTIQEIKPSCSCTKVSARLPAVLQAGDTLEVQVSMSSGRAIGTLDKHVDVLLAGRAQRVLSVPVRMRVLEGFSQEPGELRFEGVVGGAPTIESVEITWASKGAAPRPFTIESPTVLDAQTASHIPSRHFSARVVDSAGGKKIEVTLLPTHPEGRVWANLEAKLDGKLLVVPITGEMFRHIKISPTYFNFSRVSEDNPASFTKESVLTSTDERPFKVLSVTPIFTQKASEAYAITVEKVGAAPDESSRSHTLRARVVRGDAGKPGSFSGKVQVKTDHPDRPEVTLTFFGFFAEAKK